MEGKIVQELGSIRLCDSAPLRAGNDNDFRRLDEWAGKSYASRYLSSRKTCVKLCLQQSDGAEAGAAVKLTYIRLHRQAGGNIGVKVASLETVRRKLGDCSTASSIFQSARTNSERHAL